jgi:hypothetical protein
MFLKIESKGKLVFGSVNVQKTTIINTEQVHLTFNAMADCAGYAERLMIEVE